MIKFDFFFLCVADISKGRSEEREREKRNNANNKSMGWEKETYFIVSMRFARINNEMKKNIYMGNIYNKQEHIYKHPRKQKQKEKNWHFLSLAVIASKQEEKGKRAQHTYQFCAYSKLCKRGNKNIYIYTHAQETLCKMSHFCFHRSPTHSRILWLFQ